MFLAIAHTAQILSVYTKIAEALSGTGISSATCVIAKKS
jgi:hypothetical protein